MKWLRLCSTPSQARAVRRAIQRSRASRLGLSWGDGSNPNALVPGPDDSALFLETLMRFAPRQFHSRLNREFVKLATYRRTCHVRFDS